MEGENNTNQNPAPSTAPQTTAPAQVDNTTLMAILAYFGPLVIIPFLTAKENPFVKFHIKQGLVLLVIWAAIWVVGMMLGGYMFYRLIQILDLAVAILAILGIVNVVNKKEAELPIVGQFSKHFNI